MTLVVEGRLLPRRMTLHFYVSRAVAETLQIETIQQRVAARGLTDARLDYRYVSNNGRCLVTCQPAVADILIEELSAAIVVAATQTIRRECSDALRELLIAVRQSQNPTPTPRIATG